MSGGAAERAARLGHRELVLGELHSVDVDGELDRLGLDLRRAHHHRHVALVLLVQVLRLVKHVLVARRRAQHGDGDAEEALHRRALVGVEQHHPLAEELVPLLVVHGRHVEQELADHPVLDEARRVLDRHRQLGVLKVLARERLGEQLRLVPVRAARLLLLIGPLLAVDLPEVQRHLRDRVAERVAVRAAQLPRLDHVHADLVVVGLARRHGNSAGALRCTTWACAARQRLEARVGTAHAHRCRER